MNDTSNQDQAPEEKESVQEMLKDINEFVFGVSKFPAEKKEKLMFAFRIYDIDNDGFISNRELYQVIQAQTKKPFSEFFLSFQVLKMMVGTNLKDTHLQQVVDKTMRSVDRDQDGKISFEEFCKIVDKTDFDKKFVTILYNCE